MWWLWLDNVLTGLDDGSISWSPRELHEADAKLQGVNLGHLQALGLSNSDQCRPSTPKSPIVTLKLRNGRKFVMPARVTNSAHKPEAISPQMSSR